MIFSRSSRKLDAGEGAREQPSNVFLVVKTGIETVLHTYTTQSGHILLWNPFRNRPKIFIFVHKKLVTSLTICLLYKTDKIPKIETMDKIEKWTNWKKDKNIFKLKNEKIVKLRKWKNNSKIEKSRKNGILKNIRKIKIGDFTNLGKC